MNGDCPDCKVKNRQINTLAEQCENHYLNLQAEMKRTTHLSSTLVQIYEMAKNNMWYPCSFENHEAADNDQKKYTGEIKT